MGVPTYTMKYEKKERAMPQLSGRPFIKEFFPQELWGTLDGTDGHGGTVKGATRKKLILASDKANMSVEEKRRAMMEKIGEVTADGPEDEVMEEEGEGEEEEQDYNYEDDEDEMGGDYDAEQYFDDGDGGDDDEGGGGGDDY